jgi:integrase/recombinase XerD
MSIARKKRDSYLTPYRRHADTCTEKQSEVRCDCPIWCQGKVRGKYLRESLNTRSMGTAEMKIRERLDPRPDGPDGGLRVMGSGATLSLSEAARHFLKAKEGRATSTQAKYRNAAIHFAQYGEAHGVIGLAQITPHLIQQYFFEYGDRWKSERSKNGRLTCLRVFFNYAVEMDWLVKSPAAKKALNFDKTISAKRRPFTADEVQKILAAVEGMPEPDRDRARALTMVLLYSGMRISDAAWLERASIQPNRILDYWVIKTRKKIGLAPELNECVTRALDKLPGSRVFFFQPDRADDYRDALAARHSGKYFEKHLTPGTYQAQVQQMAKLVRRVLKAAGIEGGPHHFRDTFAVNLLAHGGGIFMVSQMLGHSDVKITQRHYVKLVPGYVERLSHGTRLLNYEAA